MSKTIFSGIGPFTGGNGNSLSSGSTPSRLETVSGPPPLLINRALPRKPEIITIYGNTVNGHGVGDRTVNLFDTSWITSSSQISHVGNDLILTGYVCQTNITMSLFCSLLGLSEGDIITISRMYTNAGSGVATGRIIFGDDPASQALIREGRTIKTWTVPSGALTSDKPLIMYGNTGGTPFTIYDFIIVKGSYTSATMPPYEPYGYKTPCTVISAELDERRTSNLYTHQQIHSGEILSAGVEALPTLFKGTNTISIDTAVPPSGMSISYYRR